MKWYKIFSIVVVISYMFDFAFLLPLNQLSLFSFIFSSFSRNFLPSLFPALTCICLAHLWQSLRFMTANSWLQAMVIMNACWPFLQTRFHSCSNSYFPVILSFFFKYHTHIHWTWISWIVVHFICIFFVDKVMGKYFSNKRDTCQANKKANKKNGNERTKTALNREMFIEELRYWQHGHQQYNNAFIIVNRVYPFKLYFHPFKLYFCGSFFFLLHNFVGEQRANKL